MMEKEKALEIALSKIEKDFGKGAIMKLGDAAANISVSTIPSGCLQLDYALGVGGLPRGRIIEIYGPESSGKTTLALHAIAEAQKLGGTPNTRWIRYTPTISALTWITCISHSLIPVRTHWRYAIHWCEAAPST